MENIKNIDMWYNDTPEEVTKLSEISYSDIDLVYRGWCWIGSRRVGDFTFSDSLELEKAFPQLAFNWNL